MASRMPDGITQCYLPSDRGDIPAFTPVAKLVLDFATLEGCKAELSEPCLPLLINHRESLQFSSYHPAEDRRLSAVREIRWSNLCDHRDSNCDIQPWAQTGCLFFTVLSRSVCGWRACRLGCIMRRTYDIRPYSVSDRKMQFSPWNSDCLWLSGWQQLMIYHLVYKFRFSACKAHLFINECFLIQAPKMKHPYFTAHTHNSSKFLLRYKA